MSDHEKMRIVRKDYSARVKKRTACYVQGIAMKADGKIEKGLVELQRALLVDDVWRAADRLLRAALPLYHTLIGLPCLGTRPVFLRTTLPVPDVDRYFAKLDAAAPIAELVRQNPGKLVLRLSDMLPPGPLDGMPFYDQFMKPEGWRYSAGMFFWGDAGEFLGQLSLNRTEEQGDITDEELELLSRLHPHVNAAIQRLLAMEHEMAARTSLELSVQMLPLPLILVDWNLRLTYLNSAARKSVMVWQHGKEGARSLKPQNKLPLDLRQACLELQSAWNQAVRDDDMAQLRRSSVLSHQDDPSFQSTVLLVEPAKGRSLQPSFVIQFTPSSHSSEVDEQSLAKLSKLTAAESEVARLVAAGGRNEEVARELGIGVSTVRSHLRRIFEKLNITSRGKLAPLFRTI